MKIKKRELCAAAARKLRELRRELKLSSPEMAHRLRLTQNSYRKNELGIVFPNPNTLHLLIKEFGISLDWFFFNHGPQYFKGKSRELELEKKIKELQAELVETKKASASGMGLPAEVKELVGCMAADLLLNHEILAQFQRYKKQNDYL